MISLETTSDIELLKELIDTLTKDQKEDIDLNPIIDRISLLEKKQNDIINKQNDIIMKLLSVEIKINKNLENFSENIKESSKKLETLEDNTDNEEKKQRRPRQKEEDPFVPYVNAQKEYQKVSLDGVNIIHSFLNRGKYRDSMLPINIFELLAVIERFRANGDFLKVKEVDKFCSIFNMTRPQFSKIYYNLTRGNFDSIIAEVDSMIGESVFTFKKSHIYRNGHDTNMDSKDFKELVSIYANEAYPLCAACKLIHEKNDIDPFDLFIVLRKSSAVSKIVGDI